MASTIRLVDALEGIHRIFELIKTAEKAKVEALRNQAKEAFEICLDDFQKVYGTVNSSELTGASQAEVFILVAEAAFHTANYGTSRTILERYFQGFPQQDHLFCRGKMLLGQVINNESRNTNGNEAINQCRLALAEILTAIDVALHPTNISRYQFIVYNASTALWKIVHPFLRDGRAKFFASEVTKASKALERQDDSDKKWRITLLSAAALCLYDTNEAAQAVESADAAIQHMEQILSETLKEESAVLEELKNANSELEQIMVSFRKIEERQEVLSRPPRIDPDEPEGSVREDPLVALPPLEGLATEGFEHVKALMETAQKRKSSADGKLRRLYEHKAKQQDQLDKLYMQRIHYNPADSKRFASLPETVKQLRSKTLVQLQCLISDCIPEKEFDSTLMSMVKELDEAPASNTRTETLLDVARTGWRLGLRDVALKCMDLAQQGTGLTPAIRVKLDVCDALKVLSDLRLRTPNDLAGQRLSKKQAEGFIANKTIEAIKSLERSVMMCLGRVEDHCLLQEICIVLWNASIPLVQSHLRIKLYPSLRCVVNVLESVRSPFLLLRMQLHLEVARCEELSDFVGIAKEEASKAAASDYGALEHASERDTRPSPAWPVNEDVIDRNRPMDIIIQPYVELLELRSNVYESPTAIPDKVQIMLQQAKESKSKSFVDDLIQKAVFLMLQEISMLEAAAAKADPEAAEGGHGGRARLGSLISLGSDISIALLRKGPISIPALALNEMQQLLTTDRSTGKFFPLTRTLQRRAVIMAEIVSLAHAVRNVNVLQQAAGYLISMVWDPSDNLARPLIDAQILAHNLLADSFVERLSAVRVPADHADDRSTSVASLEGSLASVLSVAGQEMRLGADVRSLGLIADTAPEEVTLMKQLVILSLERGLELASSVKNNYGVQNAVIYFWNLHVHIFREELYRTAMTEVYDFVKLAISKLEAMELPPVVEGLPAEQGIDDRIRVSLCEGLAFFLEQREGNLAGAAEAAMKGCAAAGKSEYAGRRCCELASRLLAKNAAAGGKAPKGSPPPGEPPKFESHFLNAYAAIAQAELPEDLVSKEVAAGLVQRAILSMESGVAEDLKKIDCADITQERFSQLVEMQAECWTRLTRMKIIAGDTIGAQMTAEKCLELVSRSRLSNLDRRALSPRVWRWVSACERLFGVAIANIIQEDGQDENLQNELRLAALNHFTEAAGYGLQAKLDSLVVEAGTCAWNVLIPLVDMSALNSRLYVFQKKLIESLVKCSKSAPGVMQLRQQLYMSVIEGYANLGDWDSALKVVMQAFENVSSKFQKPLWQWRVIVMSKKGKNVLDGLQKLKENDPSLQAQVYAILARSSSNPKLQLESYLKCVEILREDMERVDYMLEIVQWMGSMGLPKMDIAEMLESALDALYEVEEKQMPEIVEPEEGDEEGDGGEEAGSLAEDSARDDDLKSRQSSSRIFLRRGSKSGSEASGANSTRQMMASASPSARGPQTNRSARSSGWGGGHALSRVGSVRGGGSVRGSARGGSVRGGGGALAGRARSVAAGTVNHESIEEDRLPDRLNLKQLDQLVRGLTMASLLECSAAEKVEKCVEAVFFIKKSLVMWKETMTAVEKKRVYLELSDEEKAGVSLDDFECAAPQCVEDVPADVVALLKWVPGSDFTRLMILAADELPMQVPTGKSFPKLALSVHYAMQLHDQLRFFGYEMHSLLCLAWVRMLALCAVSAVSENAEAALAQVYLKSTLVLRSMNLNEEAGKLPQMLGVGQGAIGVSAFLVRFCQQCSQDPERAMNGTSKAVRVGSQMDGPPGPFGFSTWTEVIDGTAGFNIPTTVLDMCFTLIELGQLSIAAKLALSVRQLFAAKNDQRGMLVCCTLLSTVAFYNGKFLSVVTDTISARRSLSSCGDAKLLARSVLPSARSYLRMGKLGEAREITTAALDLVAAMAQIVIARSGGHHVTAPVEPAASAETLRTKTSGGAMQHDESSFEAVTAALELTKCYCELVLAEAGRAAKDRADLRPFYRDLCSRLQTCVDLVAVTAGLASELGARAMACQDSFPRLLLSQLHQHSSERIPVDEYESWLAEELTKCLAAASKTVEVRKQLLGNVPFSERVYQPAATPADAFEDSVESKSETAPAQVSQVQPLRPFSSTLSSSLAAAEAAEAHASMFLAVLRGEHVPVLGPEFLPELSAEERYLEETRPAPPVTLGDFFVPRLQLASQLASSAAERWKGTDHANEGALLFAACLLMRLNGEGAFAALWRPPSPAPAAARDPLAEDCVDSAVPSIAIATTVPAPTEESVRARASLATQTRALVDSAASLPMLEWACAALVESFGCRMPEQAALWLMQQQSIKSREWLKAAWLKALNPASEVAVSLGRLAALEYAQWPSSSSLLQIAAEKSFLEQNSVAFRRLSVAGDPQQIVSFAPAGTVFLCLQTDPIGSILYLSMGAKPGAVVAVKPAGSSNKSAASIEVASATSKVLWFMDKMPLTEIDRRSLRTIVEQHTKWVADVAKFVAIYGENTSRDFDVEGAALTHESGNLKKSERALAERFRALVDDLERSLAPLVGKGSRLTSFLPDALQAAGASATLLLLVDSDLQSLPLEALSSLGGFAGCTCRDFSLHLYSHRLRTCSAAGAAEAAGAALEAATVSVNSSKTMYLVDPLREDPGNAMDGFARPSLRDHVKTAVLKPVPGAAKWKDVLSGPGQLSLQDWLLALNASNEDLAQTQAQRKALFVSTLRKLGSLLPPMEAVSMDLERLALIACFDLTHNDTSFRRQNSTDVLKALSELESEAPAAMAAVLSLCGAGCVMQLSWSTPFAAQLRFMENFWREFATNSSTVAKSVAEASNVDKKRNTKRWIRFSRVVYGLFHIIYQDN